MSKVGEHFRELSELGINPRDIRKKPRKNREKTEKKPRKKIIKSQKKNVFHN